MLWGEPGLFDYIKALLRHLPPSDMEQLSAVLALAEELRHAHLEEFPGIPWQLAPEELEVRATEEFQTINERFPHVGRRLIQTWGSYAFYMYSGTLFADTRGGTRCGFPDEILTAITRIVKIHEQAYPRLDPRRVDIWADVFHDGTKG